MRFSGRLILVSAIIFSFISSYFVWRFGISADLWLVSVVFMIFFAAPSFISLWNANKKQALLVIITLSVFSLAIESFAIATGFPYGSFYYGGGLGPKVLGLAPVMVPFAWVPLVIGSYSIISRFIKGWRIIPLVAILLVIVDLVLDPGAYALKVWIWTPPGIFYGVPLQNFVGWFISGSIGALMMHSLFRDHIKSVQRTSAESSLLLTLTFWTGISFWFQMIVPCLIGITLLIFYLILTTRNQR